MGKLRTFLVGTFLTIFLVNFIFKPFGKVAYLSIIFLSLAIIAGISIYLFLFSK